MRHTIFLLMLLGSFVVSAQRDFRQGFIITLQNDSISGKILFRDSEKKFEECAFLKTEGGESVVYGAHQIKGYSLSGRSYMSRDIVVDLVVKKAFVEVYVYGKANLFFAYGRYFLEKDGIIKELAEKKTAVNVNGSQYVRTDKEFRNVLNSNLSDCPSVAGHFSNTIFSGPSLTKAVERYNNCFPESNAVKVSKANGKWFQLTAGLNIGHSSASLAGFDGTSFSGIADPKQFGKDENIYPGISFEFNSPLTSENLALHVDIFYQKNSLQSGLYPDTQTRTAISWEFKTINLPISVSYYFFNLERIRFFAEAGVSLYLRSNSIIKIESQTTASSGSGSSVNDSTLPTQNKTSTLVFGGVGLVYKVSNSWNIALKARYENGEFKINDNEVFKANYFNQTFSVVYKF